MERVASRPSGFQDVYQYGINLFYNTIKNHLSFKMIEMKKYFVVLFLTLIIATASANNPTIHKNQTQDQDFTGTVLFGAGLYLGYYGYDFLGTRSVSFPPMTAYLEYGFHEFITAGPFVGFGRWDYRYSSSDFAWSFYHFGGRGSFHLTNLINEVLGSEIDASKIDLYLTVTTGIEIRNYSSATFPDLYDNSWRIFLGPNFGFRYYLTDNLGLYLEGGRGALGALSFGLSVKF